MKFCLFFFIQGPEGPSGLRGEPGPPGLAVGICFGIAIQLIGDVIVSFNLLSIDARKKFTFTLSQSIRVFVFPLRINALDDGTKFKFYTLTCRDSRESEASVDDLERKVPG